MAVRGQVRRLPHAAPVSKFRRRACAPGWLRGATSRCALAHRRGVGVVGVRPDAARRQRSTCRSLGRSEATARTSNCARENQLLASLGSIRGRRTPVRRVRQSRPGRCGRQAQGEHLPVRPVDFQYRTKMVRAASALGSSSSNRSFSAGGASRRLNRSSAPTASISENATSAFFSFTSLFQESDTCAVVAKSSFSHSLVFSCLIGAAAWIKKFK